jgi:hypothetical protein
MGLHLGVCIALLAAQAPEAVKEVVSGTIHKDTGETVLHSGKLVGIKFRDSHEAFQTLMKADARRQHLWEDFASDLKDVREYEKSPRTITPPAEAAWKLPAGQDAGIIEFVPKGETVQFQAVTFEDPSSGISFMAYLEKQGGDDKGSCQRISKSCLKCPNGKIYCFSAGSTGKR